MSALEPKPQARHPQATRDRALEGLFLQSPVPMLFVEVRSRRITRANAALGELLGCSPQALAGRTLRELDSGDADDISEHLLLALTCGDRSPRRRTWHSPSGKALNVEIQATRLDGSRSTVLVLYVREAPSRARDARRDGPVPQGAARTQEVADRLATGIAQEFGAILEGVTDTVRNLQREVAPDSDVAPGLKALLESGDKARSMVRDFMAFTGQQTLRPRTVSLNQVVKEAEDALRAALPQDVGFMVRLCKHTTDVTVDPEQLKEILVRLVERAEFSMPEGGYVIVSTEAVVVNDAFARAHPPVRPGPHVALSITDTGEALDEEARRRIFEPFFSTRQQGQGSGLGLATVYGLASQSGGTIEVTSRPGAGTTFRVYLPRVEA